MTPLASPASTNAALSCNSFATRRFCSFLESFCAFTGSVYASSSSVYGANDVLPKHEGLATRPVSPYAASKLATEAYSLAWSHSYGLPVLALRLFYGLPGHEL